MRPLWVRDEEVSVDAGRPVTVALADQGPTIEGGLKDHSPHGSVLASGEQVGTSVSDAHRLGTVRRAGQWLNQSRDIRTPHLGRPETERDETEADRLDRNYLEMLQELRVLQAGMQILFAFLLSLAFASRFDETTDFQRDLYIVTLVCAALATALSDRAGSVPPDRVPPGMKDDLIVARTATWQPDSLPVPVDGRGDPAWSSTSWSI